MNWWKALFSAFLFGIATPFSKVLLEKAHPFLLASLFYLGAALVLVPQSIYLQTKRPLKNLSKTDILNLLGSLFFGGMVGPVLLLFGLRYTATTNASLLLNLETPATMILAYWFFKENISRRGAMANAGIVLAGVVLTFRELQSLELGLRGLKWRLPLRHSSALPFPKSISERISYISDLQHHLISWNACVAFDRKAFTPPYP